MDRPNHGFDRNASHTEDRYVCDCGYDDCQDADITWMNWAEAEIERLQEQAKGDGYVIDRQQAEIERLQSQNKRLISRGFEDLHDENERLRAVLDAEARNRQRILDEQEAEIERLRADNQELNEALQYVNRNLGERIERLRAALNKVLPDLPRHKGLCVNDNLYLEPEQITFAKCDYCRAREVLQEVSDE